MAAKPDKVQERASKEATDWLILLQDDPDDPDLRHRFNVWLSKSTVNAAAWTATQHTAGIIAAAPPADAERWASFVAERQAAKREFPHSRHTSSASPARRRRFVLQAGALAFAACLALVFMPNILLSVKADYATGTAELRTVQLEDGSSVVLAPDSAINVAYTGNERRVRLLAGEVYFEVAPNPKRPFRVTARHIETTVLGTAFEVRKSDEGAAIAVQHGVVRVDYKTVSPPVAETLEAGESVRVAWKGQAIRSSEPPTQVAVWRQGQLVAQDEPMGEVVDQLRGYYGGKIILADRALAGRPVTGVYNLADPVDALRGIARAHGATVRRVTPWLLIVSAE